MTTGPKKSKLIAYDIVLVRFLKKIRESRSRIHDSFSFDYSNLKITKNFCLNSCKIGNYFVTNALILKLINYSQCLKY